MIQEPEELHVRTVAVVGGVTALFTAALVALAWLLVDPVADPPPRVPSPLIHTLFPGETP